MAWLMVPYMMWMKMTLSIACVFCIFLTTTYQMTVISNEIIINLFLIIVFVSFLHIVRQYDDEVSIVFVLQLRVLLYYFLSSIIKAIKFYLI